MSVPSRREARVLIFIELGFSFIHPTPAPPALAAPAAPPPALAAPPPPAAGWIQTVLQWRRWVA